VNNPLVVGNEVYDPATGIGDIVIRGALDKQEIEQLSAVHAFAGDIGLRCWLHFCGYEWMTQEQYEDLEASTQNAWEARLKGE